eukprot:COSAG06_NODE_18921_length_861_cov_3.631234_1_plen_162_part_00
MLAIETLRQEIAALEGEAFVAFRDGDGSVSNLSDSTVQLEFMIRESGKLVTDYTRVLVPMASAGIAVRRGGEVRFKVRSATVGTWKSTDHHVQHAAIEGSARSGVGFRCGAVVCHADHPRFSDYRGDPIPPLIRGLQAERRAVSLQSIAERGQLEFVYART